ncbi:TPA: hypothetical protein RI762_001429 [Vibrio cholerae]|uniref:hypothetical protein n=1 Tax=Vibrio navarrensis TaxID=29495 RepID=UPI00186972CF|nr:hypothetical protein [Vibrio navarrensis]HDV5289547.1 hypothetical protein [Vibrio cholerae]MBE4594583.1 hypothetical protein [Vibrio navarrensis]HDV5459211.1 hypothetical protein [Vibrio cholerae]HDV5466709.1 hypothetical protein [Vibrio cholerae]HDV5470274.1 hypothetical protein [Vibrio cholerae]
MTAKKQSKSISEVTLDNLGTVKRGKVLEHPVFGIGTVIDIAEWASGDITINIDFKENGTKWLVPEFAKLSEPTESGPSRKVRFFNKVLGKF